MNSKDKSELIIYEDIGTGFVYVGYSFIDLYLGDGVFWVNSQDKMKPELSDLCQFVEPYQGTFYCASINSTQELSRNQWELGWGGTSLRLIQSDQDRCLVNLELKVTKEEILKVKEVFLKRVKNNNKKEGLLK